MGITAILKQIGNQAKAIWQNRKLIGLTVILLMGLGLICSAVFILKGLPLIICLMMGGILIMISCYEIAVARRIKLYEAEKKVEENELLRERVSSLERQIEDFRKKKLQVLNVQSILELGILEAECQSSECLDIVFDKKDELIIRNDREEKHQDSNVWDKIGDFFLGSRKTRFIGTFTVKFTAKYGIDMKSLKVQCDDENKKVYVEGAEPSYLGCKGFPKSNWEGCVALREQSTNYWIADDKVAGLMSRCKENYRKEFEEKLQNGPENLEWLKQPLRNTVKHLLQMMIAPPGYLVIFVDKIEGKSVTFFEYAAGLGLDMPKLSGNDNA